jgi:hypothetical protein
VTEGSKMDELDVNIISQTAHEGSTIPATANSTNRVSFIAVLKCN